MKISFKHWGRGYTAFWNEKQYGARRTCYITTNQTETGSQKKLVFHASDGDCSWGNATHEFAKDAFQAFSVAGIAPFSGYDFIPKPEFSVKEAAYRLNVSVSTVYRRIHAGKVQVRRVKQASGRWQYVVAL